MKLYVIVELNVEVTAAGGMSEETAIAEFEQETNYTFNNTENIKIISSELLETTIYKPEN